MHLDLYLTGYRAIPTIGWLFLLQLIVAFALALAVLVTGSRLAAAAGAGFALATLGGYLLSIWVGLFGFKEVRTTAGIVAGVLEVAAFAVLAVLAARPAVAIREAPIPLGPLRGQVVAQEDQRDVTVQARQQIPHGRVTGQDPLPRLCRSRLAARRPGS
jgi:hypothetical protein